MRNTNDSADCRKQIRKISMAISNDYENVCEECKFSEFSTYEFLKRTENQENSKQFEMILIKYKIYSKAQANLN